MSSVMVRIEFSIKQAAVAEERSSSLSEWLVLVDNVTYGLNRDR
jgi:hypothetical protein